MPYIASNYATNKNAPAGMWTCAPTSRLGPFSTVPTQDQTRGTDLCGQCVSYVKKVCPSLPNTGAWRKGSQVKTTDNLSPGTVIATFNASGHYQGHAAIFVSKTAQGIMVYDQYVTPPSPKPVGQRLLRWGAHGNSNNGDNFYVVE
ncbi:MAG TPA: BPSL0067 family protein [Methanosarcina sp.]|nr:BPSL0067 family protein [Methanosarcina sp.]